MIELIWEQKLKSLLTLGTTFSSVESGGDGSFCPSLRMNYNTCISQPRHRPLPHIQMHFTFLLRVRLAGHTCVSLSHHNFI